MFFALFLVPFYLFTAPSPPVYLEDGSIDKAYVTYATKNYFPLVEILLESVQAFSKYPIVVVGVNEDVPFPEFRFPFLVKKRIDIPGIQVGNANPSGPTICLREVWFQKPRAILEANVKHGIFVDADCILAPHCDELFQYCEKTSYPLCFLSNNEIDFQRNDWFDQSIRYSMMVVGIDTMSMHYVNNPVIVFSQKHNALIKEWDDVCVKFGIQGANVSDEQLLNAILWKYGATEHLPLLPCVWTATEAEHPYVFHGCKDVRKGKEILRALSMKAMRRR